MQMSLDFDDGGGPLEDLRDRLTETFGRQGPGPDGLDPLSQLVRAMLGSRTKDEVSWAAFMRLASAFPKWSKIIEAGPEAVEPLIAEVTRPEVKARHLATALWQIKRDRGVLSLDFLGRHGVDAAFGWLCGLTGVGPKSAACVLNFSRLRMRALVVDTHVYRVARRLGLIGWTVDEARAYGVLMGAAPDRWGADDLFDLHWLMKLHGQQCCTHAQPRCHLCPLAATCPKHGVKGAAVLDFRAASLPAPP
jgi:endonuclease-3